MHVIIAGLGWLHRTDTHLTVCVRGLDLSVLDIYALILGTSERACVCHFTFSLFLSSSSFVSEFQNSYMPARPIGFRLHPIFYSLL